MIFFVAALLFGMSVFMIFFYFGSTYTEDRMIAGRIKLLQQGAPTVMAKQGMVNMPRSGVAKRKQKKSMEYNPAFFIPWVFWCLASLIILKTMNANAVTYVTVIVIVPFGLLDIIKILKKRRRSESIRSELPGALDLMVVCLEAGLGVNAALLRIANELEDSPLGIELRRTSEETAAGIPLGDALRGFAKRTENPDIHTVVASIVQSEKMGSAVAVTFRVQAESLREKYKMSIKEKINRIPVKILFPLVTFLFPTLFIVILGPSIFALIGAFGNGGSVF